MTGFELSPGITPQLVSGLSVEIPLALGLAYLLFRGRGLEVAFGSNGAALGLFKLYTDYTDPFDALLAGTVLVASLTVVALATVPEISPTRPLRIGLLLLGVYALPLGAIKIASDFYDPFDTFLADFGIVAGAILLLRWLPAHARRPLPVRLDGLLVAGTEGALLASLLIMWRGTGWPWLLAVTIPPVFAVIFLLLRRESSVPQTPAE